MMSSTKTTSLLLSLLLLQLLLLGCNAYVVHRMPHHVPANGNTKDQKERPLVWLEQMTENICSTKPGFLSHELLETAPQLMDAWAHSEEVDAMKCAEKVESLVKRVVEERHAGNEEATMTWKEYHFLLESWARSAIRSPTTTTATTTIAVAQRCQQILIEMQRHEELKPPLVCFKTVLMAWRASSKQDPEQAARGAQQLLEWMTSLYRKGENPVCPDADCFDMVLQMWAGSSSKDAPEQTEKLLVAMEKLSNEISDVKPRTTSFNAVLKAWATSDRNFAKHHAVDILRYMEDRSKKDGGATNPDPYTYMNVLKALSRKGDCHPTQASALLGRVERRYEEGNQDWMPDTPLYNAVIACWAKSRRPRAYRRAQALLERLQQRYKDSKYDPALKPNVYAYTSVLTACSNERRERTPAFEYAMSVFEEQMPHQERDHVTYAVMLKCCARLLPKNDPRRSKIARKIFSQAARDGCVDQNVVDRLHDATQASLYIDRNQLPPQWTERVTDSKVPFSVKKQQQRRKQRQKQQTIQKEHDHKSRRTREV